MTDSRSRPEDRDLHARELHPDFEYETTRGPRKDFDDEASPEGDGWTRNLDRGVRGEGWERFDFHEEAYWMRPRVRPGIPCAEPGQAMPVGEAATSGTDDPELIISTIEGLHGPVSVGSLGRRTAGKKTPAQVELDGIREERDLAIAGRSTGRSPRSFAVASPLRPRRVDGARGPRPRTTTTRSTG